MATLALFASTTVFGDIAGTYVLDQDKNGSNEDSRWSLTLAVDDDGNYSATVTTLTEKLKAKSVEVKGNEFSFSITREDASSEYKVLYSGTVENGEMSGSFTIGEGKMFFSAKLKEEESEGAQEQDEKETEEDESEI